MRKTIIILILCLGLINTASSQSAVAKLKYEDAEAAYNSGDYTTALTKLNDAEKLLGEGNPRTRYLKIMVLNKMIDEQIQSDLELIVDLRSQCKFYLTEYEKELGSEEKYKDVYVVLEQYKDYEFLEPLLADAKAGKTASMIRLSQVYRYASNYQKGLEWLKKAVDKNDPLAFAEMGLLEYSGIALMDKKPDYAKALSWFNKAIEQNSPEGLRYLSYLYDVGDGVPKDSLKSNELVRQSLALAMKAAENGDVKRMILAGSILRNKRFNDGDTTKSFYWLNKAAELKGSNTHSSLASLYQSGYGVSKDLEKAVYYYKLAAQQGDFFALGTIARIYESSYNDPKTAFEYYLAQAKSGDAFANNRVGRLYEDGTGVTRSPEKAFYYFLKTAKKGYASAAYNTARCYEKGIGVEQNSNLAYQYFKQAAEKGDIASMMKVADYNYQGTGTSKNFANTFTWYMKAAEKGNVTAMSWVAQLYRDGQGVPKNLSESFNWYLKAAEKADVGAMSWVAQLYRTGEGIPKNLTESFNWYLKAAQKGEVTSMGWVSQMYKEGDGVKKDKQLAKEWQAKFDAANAKK